MQEEVGSTKHRTTKAVAKYKVRTRSTKRNGGKSCKMLSRNGMIICKSIKKCRNDHENCDDNNISSIWSEELGRQIQTASLAEAEPGVEIRILQAGDGRRNCLCVAVKWMLLPSSGGGACHHDGSITSSATARPMSVSNQPTLATPVHSWSKEKEKSFKRRTEEKSGELSNGSTSAGDP